MGSVGFQVCTSFSKLRGSLDPASAASLDGGSGAPFASTIVAGFSVFSVMIVRPSVTEDELVLECD